MRDMTIEDNKNLIREVWGKDARYGLAIAQCEGEFKQFNKDGTILRGRINPHDIGIMQINSDHHEDTYLSMKIDVFTPRGNIEYGKVLFDQSGMAPWEASRPCWKNKIVEET